MCDRKKRWAAALMAGLLLLSAAALRIGAASYKKGASGETVRTIQTKLKRWGYYSGSVDGIYGSATVEAVKSFQRKNGLTADGVCGKKTLAALGITTPSSTSSASAGTKDELYLLAKMISAEARGEPYIGQVAVGAAERRAVQPRARGAVQKGRPRRHERLGPIGRRDILLQSRQVDKLVDIHPRDHRRHRQAHFCQIAPYGAALYFIGCPRFTLTMHPSGI